MKRFSLDLGSSSLGWMITDDGVIVKKGVITFDSGMIKGSGGYSSPTKDRREKRLKRNSSKARKYRKGYLLQTLVDRNMVPLQQKELDSWLKYRKGKKNQFPNNPKFLSWLQCDFSFNEGEKYSNPYELRVKALDYKLTPMELGRALYHLVQRRGFKDIGEKNNETKKQINRRKESGFQESLGNHRSIGEALKNDYLDKNLRARDNYPYRDEYEAEVLKILKKQSYTTDKDDNSEFIDPFVKKVRKAIIWQQPLKPQKNNIGKCTFEPKKKRCALSHPLFEISRAWQFINTIKVYNQKEEACDIPKAYKEKLFLDVFLKKDKNFKFEDIRKALDKLYQQKKKYNYPLDEKKGTYETTVAGMPFCKGVIKLFGKQANEQIKEFEKYSLDTMPKLIKDYSLADIWHAITEFDNDFLAKYGREKLEIKDRVKKTKQGDVLISPLIELKEALPKGYGNLSQYVLKKIIPLLKEGFLYNEAILLANLNSALENNSTKVKNALALFNEAKTNYKDKKTTINITNKLIEIYKGDREALLNGEIESLHAFNDYDYVLQPSDIIDIKKACELVMGNNKWSLYRHKDELIQAIAQEYQEFYFDQNRKYRTAITLQDLFEELLSSNNITLKKPLYHHSNRPNIYGSSIKDNKTGKQILPLAINNSIKNPMFTKAMTVLRKLVNQLIIDNHIDEETIVTVEIARELNDNNKREAIELYQREREVKRDKIRAFLKEFNNNTLNSINVEDKISMVELWMEQSTEVLIDEKGKKHKNRNNEDILKLKNEIDRYNLWMEQKGQCFYTGKMISISQLFSSTINVEHTIPRKLLPDNTAANKTIAYRDYNTNIKKTELPINLPNFDKDIEGIGTAIKPRLQQWYQKRNYHKIQYETRLRPKGNEDEVTKNKRIKYKHYHKLHLDYWNDKLERFTALDVNDKWARRQLTDTQSISKYAREFLKTYFKRVTVEKGIVTAQFRKMLQLEDANNPKDRSKHTHHIIDAFVLSCIPLNANRRDKLIKKAFELKDTKGKQLHFKPYEGYNSRAVKQLIENSTLAVYSNKDKVTKQTFKKLRKNGKIQYKTDKNGNKLLTQPILQKGDTIRASLFKDSLLGKIKNVVRDEEGKPLRNKDNTDWLYETGKNEYAFVLRKNIDTVNKSNIKDIIDPKMANHIKTQLGKGDILDFQGNKIRHVRMTTKSGKIIKERVDYKSAKYYKNFYYAQSDSVPYAIMLFEPKTNKREMVQIHAYQVADVLRDKKEFDIHYFIEKHHPTKQNCNKILMRVGQKVIVLNNDNEFKECKKVNFQVERLYQITQFKPTRILLKHHLIATNTTIYGKAIKEIKSNQLLKIEQTYNLPAITEDTTILDNKARLKDFEDKKYKLNSLKDYRFSRLVAKIGIEATKNIKNDLGKLQIEHSTLQNGVYSPFLKIGKSENWNFLYEGYDFELDITGNVTFL